MYKLYLCTVCLYMPYLEEALSGENLIMFANMGNFLPMIMNYTINGCRCFLHFIIFDFIQKNISVKLIQAEYMPSI